MSVHSNEIASWLHSQLCELSEGQPLKSLPALLDLTPSDLGFDSAMVMDLAARIEDKFEIIVTAETLHSETRFSQLLSHLVASGLGKVENHMRATQAKAASVLSQHGWPTNDSTPALRSPNRFASGADYGVEIPIVNSLYEMQLLLEGIKSEGFQATRFNETHGSFLLSDSELKEMLHCSAEHDTGIVIGLGPRPEYDVKASFYRTQFGLEQGRQLNNHDQLGYSVEEAFRLVDLGVTGINVYDLGVLRVLNSLRESGELPKSLRLKTSSHLMPTNAVMAKIFREQGADSITTAHDLSVPVLQEMRRLVPDLTLDVPIDVYRTKGGYIRFYEIGEIAERCSPVFLKMGASTQAHPYDPPTKEAIKKRAYRIALGLEYLRKHNPTLVQAYGTDPIGCIPNVKRRTRAETTTDNVALAE